MTKKVCDETNLRHKPFYYSKYFLSFRGNFSLVFFHFGNKFLPDGHVIFETEHIPNGIPRHSLCFFEQSKTLETFVFGFVFAQSSQRFQQSTEDRFLCRTRTDYISTDTIDRSSWKSSTVESSMIVTWSESQRIGRLTWRINSGTNNNIDDTLSAATSVG